MLLAERRVNARLDRIPRRSARRIAAIGVAMIASLGWLALTTTRAAAREESEQAYRVKVAFLFNFASLVTWPKGAFDHPESPFVICHLGDSKTGALFDAAYAGRMVERHPVEVRHPSGARDVLDCHIVMITAERSEEAGQFLSAVAGQPILTVGETEGFARSGGMIGFYDEGSKIRFEINRGAAESANLRISSRLLKLARLVSSKAG